MSNGKKYICFGLIFSGIAFIIRHLDLFYIILPNFIKGFLEGFFVSLGLILILFGVYCENIYLKIIKELKIKISTKMLRK